MSSPPLRPRSSTEILDASIRIYRRHFGPILTLGLVAMLPSYALIAVLIGGMGLEMNATPPAWVMSIVPLLVLATLWLLLAESAILAATSDALLGREVSAAAALRRALSRKGPVLGAVVLKWIIIYAVVMAGAVLLAVVTGLGAAVAGGRTVSLLVLLAIVAMVALALYVYARLFAVPATAVLEDNGVAASLGRASALARGSIRRILAVFLLTFLLLFVVSMALLIAATVALSFSPVAQAVAMLPYLLVYPLLSVVTAVLYYDLRIRREGFDIEVMAGELGPAAAGQPA